jgi:hypothetical protein
MRRIALVVLASPLSCYDPEPAASSVGDDTTSLPDGSSGESLDTESITDPSATDESDVGPSPSSTLTTSADDSSSDSTDDPTSPSSTSQDDSTDDGTTGEPAVCGDGTVAPGEMCWDEFVLYDGGDVTYAARLVDVDGDGDDDLTWMIGDLIGVRLGTGDGMFGNGYSGPTLFPSDGDVGDVDGDGVEDYAIINEWDGTLQIARGNGDGNFVDPPSSLVAGMLPRVVLVADLDGEMGAEVIVGTADSMQVFKSDGDATPQSGWGFGSTGIVHAVGLAELNGDGDPDLVYAREYAGVRSVIARLGEGDASFGSSSIIDSTGAMPTAVGGGDFDGDGDGDIAYVDGTDAMLYVQLGNGAFGFADATGVATDTDPRRMLVLDATGEGNVDVVVGHGTSNALWIIPGDGAGGFGEPLDIALAGPVDSLDFGDANGDGVPDFVTTDTNYENITVILSSP